MNRQELVESIRNEVFLRTKRVKTVRSIAKDVMREVDEVRNELDSRKVGEEYAISS